MNSLFEEMYYNDFKFKNDSISKGDEERNLFALLDKNVSQLKQQLKKENRETLEKIIDCYKEILSLECCEQFKIGIRMGGRMVIEMFFGETLNMNI